MTKNSMRTIWPPLSMWAGTFAVAVAALMAGTTLARADSVEDFYKDKRVNVLIGVNVGGGYDMEARLVSRFIGNHLPGHPTFVPQNMIGAGGIKMANYLYAVAPKDGTYMGMFPNTLIALQAVGGEGVQYDAGKFHWLGTLSTSPITLSTWHTTGVRTVEDLRQKPITVAASARGAITYTYPYLINEVLGLDMKIVTGYQGTSTMVVAMERGEVDAVVNSWSSWKSLQPQWLQEKKINVLIQSEPKAPDLGKVPSIAELATNDDDRALINLVLAGDQLGKPMALTPDVPADRVKAMREAWDKTVKDPEFLKAAEKSRTEVDPVRGEVLQGIITKVLASPQSVKDKAKGIIQ